MEKHPITYYKLPILKWFFAIAILFSFAGYSNYTSPKDIEVTTEVLVTVDKRNKKATSYKNLLEKKQVHNFFGETNISMAQLQLRHTNLTPTTIKSYSGFCSSIDTLEIYLIYNTSYIEEDSFHFLLG